MLSGRSRELLEAVYARAPMQRKKIEHHLSLRGEEYFQEFDIFLQGYSAYLAARGMSMDRAVDSYVRLCSDMMRCQISFQRTGKYPVVSKDQAVLDVYSNVEDMTSYMTGLALSLFLWKTHYDIFSFLRSCFVERSTKTGGYLEIGPGHGIFLMEAMKRLVSVDVFEVVDISPVSIDITRSVVDFLNPKVKKVMYHCQDFLQFDSDYRYDFITMGEVLEHVESPSRMLKNLKRLLTSNGVAFISTCANCPAIDHVYQFNTIEDVRDLVKSAGWKIIRDKALPVENMDLDEALAKKITVNYCALIG